MRHINKTKTNIMTTLKEITELEMDIQYQEAILSNGWHDTQEEKYEAQAELEELQQKLRNLKKYTK